MCLNRYPTNLDPSVPPIAEKKTSNEPAFVTWHAFKENGSVPENLFDYWKEKVFVAGNDDEYLTIGSHEFYLMEER